MQRGDLIAVYSSVMQGCREDRARLLSEMHSDSTRVTIEVARRGIPVGC